MNKARSTPAPYLIRHEIGSQLIPASSYCHPSDLLMGSLEFILYDFFQHISEQPQIRMLWQQINEQALLASLKTTKSGAQVHSSM